ncbi:unnamed protein product [Sphagnum tenellum]
MSILGKHSDRLISFQGDRDVLSAGGLDAAGGRGFFELLGAGRGLGCFRYLIDPFKRDIHVSFPLADLIPHLQPTVGGGWVPGNTGDDEVFVLPVGGVEAHPKCREAFPVLQLEPVYVLGVGAQAMDRESDLVDFVPQELLPGFVSWCEALDEELC